MQTLEQRREAFRKRLIDYCEEHDPRSIKYPKWLRKDFWHYWTAMNDNGKKMYFEMEKKWNTGLRLSTFVRRSQKDPRWNTKAKLVHKIQTQTNHDYEPGLPDYEAYKERMSKQKVTRGTIGKIIRNQK